jgi:N-acetylglucosamine-6-phosphate deacetylase
MDKNVDLKKENCINCITGNVEAFTISDGMLQSHIAAQSHKHDLPFFGPGLIDLQVNGINGIDFNIPSVTQQDMINATQYLLSIGVTTFFPTIVTNSDENILQMLGTIRQACEANELVNLCVGGIHLEGPFISPDAGAKGAHDAKYIRAPDWELFTKFQQAAGGKIKLITLSPEWEGSPEFIEKCRKQGALVSIGHSIANTEQINRAVKAGARLSTHLGNGVPLMLPRHPNIIWDQLAADDLYSCIIGDGIHIPDSFIKVVIKIKKDRTILVSDATCFSGMPPGEYQNHIGGTVTLDKQKRISLKSLPGLLAGAATSLLENIECLLSHKLATLSAVWQMASTNVEKMLKENKHSSSLNTNADLVMFQMNEGKIKIMRVIKNSQVVFEQ